MTLKYLNLNWWLQDTLHPGLSSLHPGHTQLQGLHTYTYVCSYDQYNTTPTSLKSLCVSRRQQESVNGVKRSRWRCRVACVWRRSGHVYPLWSRWRWRPWQPELNPLRDWRHGHFSLFRSSVKHVKYKFISWNMEKDTSLLQWLCVFTSKWWRWW